MTLCKTTQLPFELWPNSICFHIIAKFVLLQPPNSFTVLKISLGFLSFYGRERETTYWRTKCNSIVIIECHHSTASGHPSGQITQIQLMSAQKGLSISRRTPLRHFCDVEVLNSDNTLDRIQPMSSADVRQVGRASPLQPAACPPGILRLLGIVTCSEMQYRLLAIRVMLNIKFTQTS